MTFSILTVCTGNICRSPVAERLLAVSLAPAPFVRVESAGTGALTGAGVPEPARRLAEVASIDVASHAARQINPSHVSDADLILAMARDHRRYIVELAPAAMRRTFTVRELGRLAPTLIPMLPEAVASSGARTPQDAMKAAVSLAASMRGTVPPPSSPEDFDVVDPYRRSDETYERCFAELVPAARSVSQLLLAADASIRG